MYEDVIKRLQSLGYTVVDGDRYAIEFAIQRVTWTIRNECNVTEIPDGLHNIAVDMVCGEFLSMKKGSGQLLDFDVESAIKSIKEGDTQITYAVSDMKNPLDWLINYLTNCGKSQFVAYRRLTW
jgi:hypothetical protein